MTDDQLRELADTLRCAHDALSGLDERMKVDAYYGGNVRPHVLRAIMALNRPTRDDEWCERNILLDRLRTAERERDEYKRDAERYRWLRQPGALTRAAHIAVLTDNGGYVAEEELADAAIDRAAQSAEGEKG